MAQGEVFSKFECEQGYYVSGPGSVHCKKHAGLRQETGTEIGLDIFVFPYILSQSILRASIRVDALLSYVICIIARLQLSRVLLWRYNDVSIQYNSNLSMEQSNVIHKVSGKSSDLKLNLSLSHLFICIHSDPVSKLNVRSPATCC